MTYRDGLNRCEDCERGFEANKWATIRAHDEGWFMTKDGRHYCPDHIPDWVAEWRERRDQ